MASSSFIPPSHTPTRSSTPTDPPTQTPYVITATPDFETPATTPAGLFFLSMADSGYFHIFTFSPESMPFTRLTANTWDDITPALSPDGKYLAFSSNRSGYWDLYLLDLITGTVDRLTDTPEYEAAPTWSPDGLNLAYETYVNGNLDIYIRSLSDPPQVYGLTKNTAADSSPAWSPLGRQVAFISNRSGTPQVWVADLDSPGEKMFENISQSPQGVASHPAWSPDGNLLAWASTDSDSGLTGIYVWDTRNPTTPARWVSSGDWPIWQDYNHLSTRLSSPDQVYLTGTSTTGMIELPPMLLPGPLQGLTFGVTNAKLPGLFLGAAQFTPTALYDSSSTPLPGALPGRDLLTQLTDVQAPYPQINEQAFNSFQALRAQVAEVTGWDVLSSLENAYVPLSTTLDPGLGEDWLYTGRAFSLNPAQIQAGWMAIVREDFGQQTYWRIFLRTTAQDGSRGAPLTQVPWDFSARTGNSVGYENGGKLASAIPPGYWVDLTSLAIQYGWERLPALPDWRTYYSGARFNELAFTQGLDWRSAMLQLYPPESLVTPTIIIPPTRTPTRTPFWYQTPTFTSTPTFRPTNTP